MATSSTRLLALGAAAPSFTLPDTRGRSVGLADSVGRPLLVMFLCNHCPFVKHVNQGLVAFAQDYLERGLAIVAISSNDVAAYPEDGPAEMRRQAEALGYPFPYLYDESQTVARAYGAACTPDLFLFDREHRLAYHGQLDDSRPQNGRPVTGRDLRSAADAVLRGEAPAGPQQASIGCGIKWRPGNAPSYAG
jgi:peroxiredoxin